MIINKVEGSNEVRLAEPYRFTKWVSTVESLTKWATWFSSRGVRWAIGAKPGGYVALYLEYEVK